MRLIFPSSLGGHPHKDEMSYCSVAIAGDVLVRDHLNSLVKIVYVDFEHDESQGGFRCRLRHGSAKSAPHPSCEHDTTQLVSSRKMVRRSLPFPSSQ